MSRLVPVKAPCLVPSWLPLYRVQVTRNPPGDGAQGQALKPLYLESLNPKKKPSALQVAPAHDDRHVGDRAQEQALNPRP